METFADKGRVSEERCVDVRHREEEKEWPIYVPAAGKWKKMTEAHRNFCFSPTVTPLFLKLNFEILPVLNTVFLFVFQHNYLVGSAG